MTSAVPRTTPNHTAQPLRGAEFERVHSTVVLAGDVQDRSRGFTIVELLIVIVVIGILATIVTIGFNGVQKQALNTHRLAALTSWRDLFQLYSAKHGGAYPAPSGPNAQAREYCLGRGFLHDACWNVYDVYGDGDVVGGGPKPWEPVATVDNQLLDQLESVGDLPGTSTCLVAWNCPTGAADGVGPMVSYRIGKPSMVWDFFLGGSCPGNLNVMWTDGNASTCGLAVASKREMAISNLLPNPSFENGTFGWTSSGPSALSISTSTYEHGNAALRVVPTSTQGNTGLSVPTPGSTGHEYTFSVFVYSQSSQVIDIAADGIDADQNFTIGPSWQRVSVSGIKRDNGPLYVRARDASGVPFYVDAAMFSEQQPGIAEYGDGNSTGWSWTGSTNASASSGPAL